MSTNVIPDAYIALHSAILPYLWHWTTLDDITRAHITLTFIHVLNVSPDAATTFIRETFNVKIQDEAELEQDLVFVNCNSRGDDTRACQNDWTFAQRIAYRLGLASV